MINSQVIELAKRWLNHRSQRSSYPWEKLKRGLEHQKIPRPKMTEKRRLHQCALGKTDADANTTEEPDTGKPHVRDCMGGVEQSTFLP